MDGWLIDHAAQPVVDVLWARLGLSRITLCRLLLLAIAALDATAGHWLIGSWVFVLQFVSTQVYSPTEWRSHSISLTRLSLSVLSTSELLPPYDLLNVSTLIFPIYLYLVATRDPPPRKRKNWREIFHRFAADWTWLQPVGVNN